MRAIGAAQLRSLVLCIGTRVMRGSVYVKAGLAIDEVWPEKSTGQKRRRLKDSGRSPDTYIYTCISRVTESQARQHVGVGLAQARPN